MAKQPLEITALKHREATRKNIPTAELETVMRAEDKSPVQVAYERRNRDLDPQLVWRGKDQQDWSDLIVQAPPLYIQEKVHPHALVEDIKRRSKAKPAAEAMPDLFADFNGLKDAEAATEFYQHDQHWSNRMILGDSLSVMASLAEREGLRGQVQCIYFDPPYGISFKSNFQWSTTTSDVKDGDRGHVTREPEQVRAFRDTWRDGIHSYLTYLRDRLTVARDLLHESGSIFVQIGDENVHRVRALMDEIFRPENFIAQISLQKTSGQTASYVAGIIDYLLWFSRDASKTKFRKQLELKPAIRSPTERYVCVETENGDLIDLTVAQKSGLSPLPKGEILRLQDTTSQSGSENSRKPVPFEGRLFVPSGKRGWSFGEGTDRRIARSGRFFAVGSSLRWKNYHRQSSYAERANNWTDISPSGFGEDRIYVVQTITDVVQRCVLMTTDPGDLVLDPTCGSGTTAYVAEQWGRRWITIDTSRVSLALARSRLMGARYPYFLLADSPEGQKREAEVTRTAPKTTPTAGRLRLGFVYERVPHVALKSIGKNAEIDVIWEQAQTVMEPLRIALNAALGKAWEEWQVPRQAGDPWPAEAAATWEALRRLKDKPADATALLQKFNKQLGRGFTLATLPEAPRDPWPAEPTRLHAEWWKARIARQKEIDASIAAKADVEYLYDKPYEDKARIRVAGPFTVESLSPHRALAVDWNDELIDPQRRAGLADGQAPLTRDFAGMILENLRSAGVQQARKEDRIAFTSLTGWPGEHIGAEGRFREGDQERRAGILIGPEFGTVTRPQLVAAAREAADAGFDILIACAFAYDAHSAEFDRLGRLRVLRARMNPDLHMAQDLKATAKGNLFVVFGEPDIRIETQKDSRLRVRIEGVDVFKPQTGEVVSEGKDGIALWMIDTDYNEESFFVRHAYFLGANDPYKALKTTLRAEIDEAAWSSLNSDTSYPFPKPASGRIAVKVINHLGDEVMKVFAVSND